MRIAVTGADGQLGRELLLKSKTVDGSKFSFTDSYNLDITSKPAVSDYIRMFKPDWIVNCAGYTAVDNAENDEANARKVNVEGVGNIVHAIEGTSCRLIHISTDYVFDGSASTPYSEEDATNPLSVYGISKRDGENEALKSNGAIVLRTSWLYSLWGKNFPSTILRLAKERPELKVVNDQTGSPTYAGHLADAILRIVSCGGGSSSPVRSEIFHVTNSGSCSWYTFAKEIVELAGEDVLVSPVTSEEYKQLARRPKYSVLDCSKIESEMGIRLPHWKDALGEWYKGYGLIS